MKWIVFLGAIQVSANRSEEVLNDIFKKKYYQSDLRIIDEPELGLHPAAIVILATQSPAFIDQFAIEDIVVVSRKDGASQFSRLQEKDFTLWLEDYSVGELWSKNVITGGPNYEQVC